MRQTSPCPPCPDPACPHPHVVRTGTLSGRQRDHGRTGGAGCGATQGTPRYRLRTPVAEIAGALVVVRRRGRLRAAEEVTGHPYETIGPWLRLAARHAEALTAVLVQALALSTVEIDECWSLVRSKGNT